MRLWAIAILSASALTAADDQQLALLLKAQSQFDRVHMAAAPNLRDSSACIQTQASLLPVAVPGELAPTHFRKGYCMLAEAALTGRSSEFADASVEFDKAIEAWPLRATKNQPAEPMPSGLHILSAITRMEAGLNPAAIDRSRKELEAAEASPSCLSNVMPPGLCQALLGKGHEWLGWLDLRQNDLDAAVLEFGRSQATGWPAWTAGRKAFAARQYQNAASEYRRAVEVWRPRQDQSLSTMESLSPRPDLASALGDWGGAQYLAGDTSAAIATLNDAVKLEPSSARAIYFRALAKQKAGDAEGAMTDYNLASRTAFAGAKDLVSGEAHLYRGILYYRRKDFTRAEDEFSSALNMEIPTDLQGDAASWRHLAAVAAGSCAASKDHLEQSLGTVSPYFPKDEARARISACRSISSAAPSVQPVK